MLILITLLFLICLILIISIITSSKFLRIALKIVCQLRKLMHQINAKPWLCQDGCPKPGLI